MHKINIKKIILSIFLIFIVCPVLFISSVILTDSLIHPDEIPSFFGWKPFIVLTSSMENTIMAGDVAIVKEQENYILNVGDIIAFRLNNDVVVTHRVAKIGNDENSLYYVTKGDNNESLDEWRVYPNQIEGVYKFKFDNLGDVAIFIQKPSGIMICMTMPILLLLVIQLIENINYKKQSYQNEQELLNTIDELEKEKKDLLKSKKRYNSKK